MFRLSSTGSFFLALPSRYRHKTSLKRLLRGSFLLFALVAFCTKTIGQAGPARISGVLRDHNGALVQNATVTLRNIRTGVKRSNQSDLEGRYTFSSILPGIYSLRVEHSGFSSIELTGIVLNIGSELDYNLVLEAGGAREEVNIPATAPIIEPASSEVGGSITQEQISALPINTRQYLSLASILPGTSFDSTRAFFSSINVGASMTFNSTANVVDGVTNNWAEDGEPRQDFPEDAVQEFKISNAQYRAEFGLATGGIVQVVTKSGTNQFHGTLFEYVRDKVLNARNVFEKVRPDFRRHQFGGSIGGPIARDKVHFFFAAELTQQDDFYTVNTGLSQFYSSVEGTFRKPSHRNLYVGRVDWQLKNTHNLFLRYAQEDEHTECSGCGGTTASTAGFDQDTPRRGLVVGYTWINSSKRLNDFYFQYARGGYFIAPHGTKIWKMFGGFPPDRVNRLSRTYIFPSLTYGSSLEDLGPESRWQLRDAYSMFLSHHNIRLGVDYSYLPYAEERTGNLQGTYTFAQDQLFDPNDPVSLANLQGALTFTASVPPISTRKPTQYFSTFVQDEWRVRHNLTVNLGLRYERLIGSSNEDLNPAIFPAQIPFIDVSKRGNKLNFAPRIGLAWSPFGEYKTVIRAGYGIYYGHVRIGVNLGEYRNFKQFTVNINNPPYPDPYMGQDPIRFIVTGPVNINILANDFRQPYSQAYTVGISQELTNQLALTVDGVYNLTLRDRKIQDMNPRNAVGARPLSQFGRIDESQSTAIGKYQALYVTLNKRYSNRSQFLLSYTYTKSQDNNPLVRYLDPFDKSLDWGPSNGERRHALVVSGSVLLPSEMTLGAIWTLRSELPWSATAGRDLNRDGFNTDLVPGTTRNSGSRNLNLDKVNAWRQLNGLLPLDFSQIDSSAINMLDARLSKNFALKKSLRMEVMVQAFNLFNQKNLQGQFTGGRVSNALSSQFGRIVTARPGRQVELAVKFNW